jgi:replicative superfamily II helicase
VGRLLSECIYKFISSSSRVLIDEVPNLSDFVKERLHSYLRIYPELWPSQQEAISKGLLSSSNNFLVTVPTSAGKTLCGELAIIKEITDNPNAVCFYVVPTRALVEEKSQDLRRKLGRFDIRVAAPTGALQRDEIETSLLLGSQVIVCTPEKLDLLIRHDDPSLAEASLFIIDEAQMISDDERGLGLEFVVVKLLLLKGTSRILFLSAMLPNSEDFGRWIMDATVAASTWRPTRQKFGEINFRKTRPRGCMMQVDLYDSHSRDEDIRIPILPFERQPKSTWEKVIWAVEALRVKGPVLVFCMTKPRCEEIVSKIVDYLKAKKANYPIRADYVGKSSERLRITFCWMRRSPTESLTIMLIYRLVFV